MENTLKLTKEWSDTLEEMTYFVYLNNNCISCHRTSKITPEEMEVIYNLLKEKVKEGCYEKEIIKEENL